MIAYAANRWLLKPLFPSGFIHDHVNDLMCIPIWVPVMLWIQRKLRLRTDDAPPRAAEIIIPLILWSWTFEVWLPSTSWGSRYCVADPVDVLAYAAGALGAVLFWRSSYRDRTHRPGPRATEAKAGRAVAMIASTCPSAPPLRVREHN